MEGCHGKERQQPAKEKEPELAMSLLRRRFFSNGDA